MERVGVCWACWYGLDMTMATGINQDVRRGLLYLRYRIYCPNCHVGNDFSEVRTLNTKMYETVDGALIESRDSITLDEIIDIHDAWLDKAVVVPDEWIDKNEFPPSRGPFKALSAYTVKPDGTVDVDKK